MTAAAAPRVAVQILTWNRVDELVPCLESFSRIDYPNYEVIVLDNGSEDETVATVRARFPWVTLIENGENLGFCKGNNVGLRYVLARDFDYVLLLNSDTEVLPGLLHELVAVMESDPRIAIAGAKNVLLENPTYMWGQYGEVTWGPMLVRTVGRFAPDERRDDPPRDVDWVIANGCLVRCEALRTVGVFDEEFWQCNEDVDWSYRARAAGYRVVYVDRAAILHKGGSSADLSHKKVFSYGYFIGRNAFVFARKHGTPLQRAKLFVMVCIGILGRITFFALDSTKHAILGQRAFVRGMMDGLRGTLRPELITITWGEPKPRVFHQNWWGRVKRWLGV
ncbi:MAG TPA: glycosyltransferase family 2 protein [Candidatus Limnocylindria bacterium]|nr:glycosyltransferase family 2 protein [Candidatus Limnocylindria bacterium]